MALLFQRRLAIPLWAITFVTIALAVPPPNTLFLVPPTTLFVLAVVAIALLIFAIPGAVPWLRTSRSVVRVPPPGRDRDKTRAEITLTAGTCVRTLDVPNSSIEDDTLDLVRMDDDGGWQVTRPPA